MFPRQVVPLNILTLSKSEKIIVKVTKTINHGNYYILIKTHDNIIFLSTNHIIRDILKKVKL